MWAALQDAIRAAGLEIKGTQTFDKKHGTFKQFVSQNAVGYDLVLHCQPSQDRQKRQKQLQTEDEEEVLKFIRSRLRESESKDYVVGYLHVRRAREFDYRRLYAEWLTALIAHNRIDLSFEVFRELVDQVRSAR